MGILKDVENVNLLLNNANYKQVYDELRSGIALSDNREQLTSFFGAMLYKALEKKVDEAYELVEQNQKLITSRVKYFESSGCDPEDLFTIGKFGLIQSAFKFNKNMGIKLSTYVVPFIDSHIIRYLTRKFNAQRDNEFSINAPLFEDDKTVEDTIGTSVEEVEGQALLGLVKKDIIKVIKTFSQQERTIIAKRLGLLGEIYSQETIAAELGTAQSIVSRIEKKALAEIVFDLRKKYKVNQPAYIILKDDKKIIDFKRLNNKALTRFAEKYIFVKEKYNGEKPLAEAIKDCLKRFTTEDLIMLIETHGLFDKYEGTESDVALTLGLTEQKVKKKRLEMITQIQDYFGVEKAAVRFSPGDLPEREWVQDSIESPNLEEEAGKVISYSIDELREKLILENNLKMLDVLAEKPKEKLPKKPASNKESKKGKMKNTDSLASEPIVQELLSLVEKLQSAEKLKERVKFLTPKQRYIVDKILKKVESEENSLSSVAKEIGIDRNAFMSVLEKSLTKLRQSVEYNDINSMSSQEKEVQEETKESKLDECAAKLFLKRYIAAGRRNIVININRDNLVELINNLEQKEKEVLIELHGLIDGIEKNMKAVSKKLNIPKRSANELRKNAIIKIQKQLNIEPAVVNFMPLNTGSYIDLSRPETLPSKVKVYSLECR